LAIVMRSSSDWVKTPQGWQRAQTEGAATTAALTLSPTG
jgi:hypothetical protein